MPLRIQKHPKFVTKNRFKKANGFLIPIFNVLDGFVPPENTPKQAYLTVCEVGEIKGPHLHMKRWGLFTCLQGDIRIIARTDMGYEEHFTGEHHEFATVEVPAGVPSALQNIGDVPAYILNMPSPAWHAEDLDDHDIIFDESVFDLTRK